ncbi:MAG: filamentous hemagglutinin family protein [Puniceicoccaceae bacterium]
MVEGKAAKVWMKAHAPSGAPLRLRDPAGIRQGRGRGRPRGRGAGCWRVSAFLLAALFASVPSEAGDILRNGSTVNSGPTTRSNAGAGSLAAQRQTARNQQDALRRVTVAMQSIQRAQAAARGAAAYQDNAGENPYRPGERLPDIPNGLGTGGLEVDPAVAGDPSLWTGAALPSESPLQAGWTRVDIVQSEPSAILNWRTFNVGRQTVLNFDQSAGGVDTPKWIAFNQVNDPSALPSQILGQITSDGQVYVINRNGVVFGAASQVNVRGLTVSSLPINTNLIEGGLLNNPDSQFLFSGLDIPAGANGTPAFTPEPPNPLIGRYGDVIVREGATIRTPVPDDQVGGRVTLVGANVYNHGDIFTPEGQTILAAGLQVGFGEHDSEDPSLRGLDVYVGAVADPGTPAADIYAGTVVNEGLVQAARGSITLAGREIRNNGILDASTSVSLNGRIDIQASYDAIPNPVSSAVPVDRIPFLKQSTGNVFLGPGSVISVVPEYGSAETIAGSELAIRSQVNIEGRNIHVGPESVIFAPNGFINLDAGQWISTGTSNRPESTFVYSGGQIYIDHGALVSAAGTPGVRIPADRNILEVELRGPELADSPVQRDGALRTVPINVDIRRSGTYRGREWIGTPLGDATGFVGLIERGVSELTVAGGEVNLNAGGSVIIRDSAAIDVSGGYREYLPGEIETTRLLYRGRVVDIADAYPDVSYEGIYTGTTTVASERWGISETYTHPLALLGKSHDPGYAEGADGGRLRIQAPAVALDGHLTGMTIEGPRQREERPELSSFSLAIEAQDPTIIPQIPTISPTPPVIEFSHSRQNPPLDFHLEDDGSARPLGGDRRETVLLSPDILGPDGFGHVSLLNREGPLHIPAGIEINGRPGGSLTGAASNITIAGRVSIPSGDIDLSAFNVPLDTVNDINRGAVVALPEPTAGRGIIHLAGRASLDTSGLVVDDRPGTPDPEGLPIGIDGGSISLVSYAMNLEAGSLMDVSGGARADHTGSVSYGAGGSLTLEAGRDPQIHEVLGGDLSLAGTVRGNSGGTGGRLRILAPAIQIGGATAPAGVLHLDQRFFDLAGFTDIDLSGIGLADPAGEEFIPGVRIADGTVFNPRPVGLLAVPHPGANRGLGLRPFTRPEGLRSPTRFSFSGIGARDPFSDLLMIRGGVEIAETARVVTDALGAVTLKANTIGLLGSIRSPGGAVVIDGGDTYDREDLGTATEALPTVFLGPRARIDTSGRSVLIDSRPFDRRSGFVTDGGYVSLAGNLVLAPGSFIDVSGGSQTFDLPVTFSSANPEEVGSLLGLRFGPLRIDRSGGSIELDGSQLLASMGSFRGEAGGPTAGGGRFSVRSGNYSGRANPTSADIDLTIAQSGAAYGYRWNEPVLGRPVTAQSGERIRGGGFINADSFSRSGFDHLDLGGNIRFDGPVFLRADGSIRLADGGVIEAGDRVDAAAPYVAVGQDFRPPRDPGQPLIPFTQQVPGVGEIPYHFDPTSGPGDLRIEAHLIDIGTLSLQNTRQADFQAPFGFIRGNGTFNIAGEASFTASQVYPTTGGEFNLTAFDHPGDGGSPLPGTLRFNRAGDDRPPYSAVGSLNADASVIEQAGVLQAPFGSIRLGYDGTGTAPVNAITDTAVPTTRSLVLFPSSVTSVSAAHPEAAHGLTLPYGLVRNDISWIDPRGIDITRAGLPGKRLTLNGASVETMHGSTIDIRGGGDLFGYRFVSGTGGSEDIYLRDGVFAILPGYNRAAAPYAPFNPNPSENVFGDDPGYVGDGLQVGDQIYLGGTPDLPAGSYTLLPARYALLHGGLLLTEESGDPVGTHRTEEGAYLVSGYRFSAWNGAAPEGIGYRRFNLASPEVFRERAEIRGFAANRFLVDAAEQSGVVAQRLPEDSGYLRFSARDHLAIQRSVLGAPMGHGRGGFADISTPRDIHILDTGTTVPGAVALEAGILNSFDVESLLIGGTRDSTGAAAAVTVTTPAIFADTAREPLAAPDLILAANKRIELAARSGIRSRGGVGDPAQTLLFGDGASPGSGDGSLLRVAHAGSAPVSRSGVGSATPFLVAGPEASIRGNAVTLDSTYGTAIDPTVGIIADRLDLNSGRISVELADAGTLPPTDGLVLGGDAVESILGSVSEVALLGYSSIDFYGTGTFGADRFGLLAFRTPAFRAFNNTGPVTLRADTVLFENPAGNPAPAASGALSGTLSVDSSTFQLGDGVVEVQSFSDVEIMASRRALLTGTGGVEALGDLALRTPVIVSSGTEQRIAAGGNLVLTDPGGGAAASEDSSLGSALTLEGAAISIDTAIRLPSGSLAALATSGDILVGTAGNALLDFSGSVRTFFDQVRHTDAGRITLESRTGDVVLGAGSHVSLAGDPAESAAGDLGILAPLGEFVPGGTIIGSGRTAGRFALDAGAIPAGSLASLDAILNTGGFTRSRDYRIRTGNVFIDGAPVSRNYRVSADTGSILVSGTVDASGATGGSIDLLASGGVVLESGSLLDVSATGFDSAGKGGSVSLEAGLPIDGMIDPAGFVTIGSGSTIDLRIGANTASSAAAGRFEGTLDLRAPMDGSGTDLRVDPIAGTIRGGSRIGIEGFTLIDLTGTGEITSAVRNQVLASGNTFLGAAGSTPASYTSMLNRITAADPTLAGRIVFRPGAEIINRTGDLTLGTATSPASSDWNLASNRFGPLSAPGVLTLRAAGDLVFFNALSDGFSGGGSLWLAPLTAHNPLLPANSQSYDLRLTAGSDLSAADFRRVLAPENLAADKGNLLLGKNAGQAIASGGTGALTSSVVENNFQVIRTGSGDLDVNVGRDLRLLNPFASLYTAGTAVPDPGTLFTEGDFSLPVVSNLFGNSPSQGGLGAFQQVYPAQYSMAGGNVRIVAGGDMGRFTRDNLGNLLEDSSRQIPSNWLHRRGFYDSSGESGAINIGRFPLGIADPEASTTWWVNFSNFFQSVGALGGGNVALEAGGDIANIDAVVPTNARMPSGAPSADRLVEIGGGDLSVSARGDLSGGIYYVERGEGRLVAGGDVTTNKTRSPSLGILRSLNNPVYEPEQTWLPTTLFMGRSSFDVRAGGDVLLGPVANPFILPGGQTNGYWYKTYFTTYGEDSSLHVQAMRGDVTLRNSIVSSSSASPTNVLAAWMREQNLLGLGSGTAAFRQPWLRVSETSLQPFDQAATLYPGDLDVFSVGGDINLAGTFNLFPTARGNVELLARDNVNAFIPSGISSVIRPGSDTVVWSTARINLSDADPSGIPDPTRPFAYRSTLSNPDSISLNNATGNFVLPTDALFDESGSLDVGLQRQRALHRTTPAHRGDNEPMRIYAGSGSLSGLTLFAPKPTRILAGRNVSDVAFYIQNLADSDSTVVSAGRDVNLYAPNSDLRVQANADGNLPAAQQGPRAGDVQIGGPGSLLVLAGRNLDLGIGPTRNDGTAQGITSVGNLRNPFLPSDGADIIGGAGLGQVALGLDGSGLDFAGFESTFLAPGSEFSERYLPELESLLPEDLQGGDTYAQFQTLGGAERARLALEIFYRVLRDSGRDFNDPTAASTGTYATGFLAIETLFPGSAYDGDISLTSRLIKTAAEGDISLFAPGGELFVGFPIDDQPPDQGILTERGGNINIFTDGSVTVGTSRIFTLRGGNEIIWSSTGDIAAGSAAKTVQSAPPTRVIIDTQTATVETDLSGLATGGGIGVLQTVEGVEAGDVDLIAPEGVVDAGDAGIRVAGNLNIAATQVLNASNIQVAGGSTGVPTAPVVSGPNIGAMGAAASAAGAASAEASEFGSGQDADAAAQRNLPSIITIEIVGFGGGS